MATILTDEIFKSILLNEMIDFWFQISLKYVPSSPINNKPAFIQVMAWYHTGDKPLLGSMLTQFTQVHMQH